MRVDASIGAYQLVRRLAQGGMAEIFLARQLGPQGFERAVVLKCSLPQLQENPAHVTMFLDEARLSARLSHPNVVQVFNFGDHDGTPFLAMEYLVGEDLRRLLKAALASGTLPPWHISVLILMQACDGLHYAHTLTDESGRFLAVVHRDVSPANIFVTYQGTVKVLDFGIAQSALRDAHTEVGQLKGKLLYMSPEQLKSGELDARSDIFSLGVVLYEMLTGVRLFDRPSPADILSAITSAPVLRPGALNPSVPPELDEIILQALARDPAARFQSAAVLGERLHALVRPLQLRPAHTELATYLHALFGVGREREQTLFLSEAEAPTDAELEAPQSAEFQRHNRVTTRAYSAPRTATAENLGRVGTSRAWAAGAVLLLGLLAVTGALVRREVRPAPSPVAQAVTPEAAKATRARRSPVTAAARLARAVELEVQPPGEVLLGGVSQGTSPVTLTATAPAVFQLELTNPALHYRKQLALPVGEDTPARVLLTVARGKLEVRVNPYARVKVDGKSVGETPFPPLSLYEGPHEVRLRRRGSAEEVQMKVVIKPLETEVLKYTWPAAAPHSSRVPSP